MRLRWALLFGITVGLLVAWCDWHVLITWHSGPAVMAVASFVTGCGGIIIYVLATGVRPRSGVARRPLAPVAGETEMGPVDAPEPVGILQLLADMQSALPDISNHQVWEMLSLGVRETRVMAQQIGAVKLAEKDLEARQVEAGVLKVKEWLRLYIKYQSGPNLEDTVQFLAGAQQAFQQFALLAHAGLEALVDVSLEGFRQAAAGFEALPEAKEPDVLAMGRGVSPGPGRWPRCVYDARRGQTLTDDGMTTLRGELSDLLSGR